MLEGLRAKYIQSTAHVALDAVKRPDRIEVKQAQEWVNSVKQMIEAAAERGNTNFSISIVCIMDDTHRDVRRPQGVPDTEKRIPLSESCRNACIGFRCRKDAEMTVFGDTLRVFGPFEPLWMPPGLGVWWHETQAAIKKLHNTTTMSLAQKLAEDYRKIALRKVCMFWSNVSDVPITFKDNSLTWSWTEHVDDHEYLYEEMIKEHYRRKKSIHDEKEEEEEQKKKKKK